jgi:hypothetical protein
MPFGNMLRSWPAPNTTSRWGIARSGAGLYLAAGTDVRLYDRTGTQLRQWTMDNRVTSGVNLLLSDFRNGKLLFCGIISQVRAEGVFEGDSVLITSVGTSPNLLIETCVYQAEKIVDHAAFTTSFLQPLRPMGGYFDKTAVEGWNLDWRMACTSIGAFQNVNGNGLCWTGQDWLCSAMSNGCGSYTQFWRFGNAVLFDGAGTGLVPAIRAAAPAFSGSTKMTGFTVDGPTFWGFVDSDARTDPANTARVFQWSL